MAGIKFKYFTRNFGLHWLNCIGSYTEYRDFPGDFERSQDLAGILGCLSKFLIYINANTVHDQRCIEQCRNPGQKISAFGSRKTENHIDLEFPDSIGHGLGPDNRIVLLIFRK